MVAAQLSALSTAGKTQLVNEVSEKLPKIHGWCSEEKAKLLIDLILENKPTVFVEIGVFGGSSILPIAKALKANGKGKVWAIDPWKTDECLVGMENSESRSWWSSFSLEQIYDSFMDMLRKEQLLKQCRVLRMTSKSALTHVPKKIDILHIDGNHSEEACYFDTTHFLPLVKSGGYIVFDDVLWTESKNDNYTTKKAFDFALQHAEVISFVNNGNCALLKKR